jgi:hypothetical protein
MAPAAGEMLVPLLCPITTNIQIPAGLADRWHYLMVALCGGVVQRRVAAAECGVPGQPRVVLEERTRLLQVAVPGSWLGSVRRC